MKMEDIIKQVEDNLYAAFFYTPLIYKNSKSYLLKKPKEIVTISAQNDLNQSFKQINKLISKGLTGYCTINYEAGCLFEKRLQNLLKDNNENLIQFFFFDEKNVKEIKTSYIKFSDKCLEDFRISNFKLNTTRNEFRKNITRIKKYIKDGDTYQVNYSVKGKFNFKGSVSSLFYKLIFNQSAAYTSFINNDKDFIVSLSPELFFNINGDKIISKPMKGTLQRGLTTEKELFNKNNLLNDEKILAENVMIVDLIRNDLGRVCKYGSINVPDLFTIEKYESLFQLTSTVKGTLNKESLVTDVIKKMFPCGSVTGTPKIRTMEIIDELEKEERGIYTGSIGLINKEKANFNVAIRTMTLNKETYKGELGIGAGIVWDSNADDEYDETLLKSKFLTSPPNYFGLIETMKVEKNKVSFFDEHLTRLKNAADYFLFCFDETKIRKAIFNKVNRLDYNKNYKLRLLLNKWGEINIETDLIMDLPETINVVVSGKKINSQNKFQFFKTTSRDVYDKEYARYYAKGFFDVLFLNEKDEIAEGAITNIFIKVRNEWFTPPLVCGILNGIYRSKFLKKKNVKEKTICINDILNADALMLVNSVRGEVKVNQLFINDEIIDYNLKSN